MSQYLALIDNNPVLTNDVKQIVDEYNSMSDGDKLAIATKIVEKEKKQEKAMDIMANMLRNQKVQIKAYEEKLGRSLTEKEIQIFVNKGSLPALMDDIDKELLREAAKITQQCKQLTGK